MASSPLEPLLTPLQFLPEPVMLGLSGGVDSIAMLHALILLKKKPILLHFDHGWRPESKKEVLSLQKLALSHHLPFYTQRASSKIPQTETAARQARDLFFKQASKKFKTPHLLLAHHANDQVETFLLQLFRGTGSQAFGMSPQSLRDGIIRYRPWLSIWKKEILHFAKTHHLTWHEDSSNLETHHRRNWIRHELLPLIDQKMNRATAPLLHRTALLLRDQTEALHHQIENLIPHPTLAISELIKRSTAEQRLLIKSWLEFHQIPDLDFDLIEKVAAFSTQKTPAKINLPRGHFVRRTQGKIWIQKAS